MQLTNIMRFSNAQFNLYGVYCMSLFTKYNYSAKKFNYLTLRGKSNVNGL
jgi:hypothetical protein